jgi:hypothetical protein
MSRCWVRGQGFCWELQQEVLLANWFELLLYSADHVQVGFRNNSFVLDDRAGANSI